MNGRGPLVSSTVVRARWLWLRWRPAIRTGLSIVGAGLLAVLIVNPHAHGTDLRGYWSFDPKAPYAAALGNVDATVAFRYAPPVALIMEPLRILPWPLALAAWTLLLIAALIYLGRSWAVALLALYPIALEVAEGNINLLLAVAIVLGFRYPAAWSFVLLTKVTPGVGLLWFAVRREWRSLAVAVGVTAFACAVSYLLAPTWWPRWIAMLASDAAVPQPGWPDVYVPLPLVARVILAGVVVVWGARTDRPWMLPVACMLALPVTWVSAGGAVLLGVVPILRDRQRAASAQLSAVAGVSAAPGAAPRTVPRGDHRGPIGSV